ncbi:hypothetical protein GGR50DRAFT_699007 [Xylaria sp. CBS 124048]|nr:hypothetical protein GGR50DRAFT_699007 [Xylaria sp. CBS 124048]
MLPRLHSFATWTRLRNLVTIPQCCHGYIALQLRYVASSRRLATQPRQNFTTSPRSQLPRRSLVTLLRRHDFNYLTVASSLRYNSATSLRFCSFVTILQPRYDSAASSRFCNLAMILQPLHNFAASSQPCNVSPRS